MRVSETAQAMDGHCNGNVRKERRAGGGCVETKRRRGVVIRGRKRSEAAVAIAIAIGKALRSLTWMEKRKLRPQQE